MAAYVVIDRLSVTDPDRFSAYHDIALLCVTTHGGRYVMPHGMQIEALEGNWTPNRIVLIEFDDAEQARRWWDSPAYARARTIHRQATISNIILVDGAAYSPAIDVTPQKTTDTTSMEAPSEEEYPAKHDKHPHSKESDMFNTIAVRTSDTTSIRKERTTMRTVRRVVTTGGAKEARMFRKTLSLIIAVGVMAAFSMFGRTGIATAGTLPSGDRTFGQKEIEPAYDATTGGLIYLSTPLKVIAHPNPHNTAPLYIPVYPTSSQVGTLNCEDVPVENCPGHGPGLVDFAKSEVPSVYGSGVLGHDHIGGVASSGGDFNVLWVPVIVFFTNSQAANTMHLTTLAQIKSAEASGDAFEIALPPATFNCAIVSASAYEHGVPVTG